MGHGFTPHPTHPPLETRPLLPRVPITGGDPIWGLFVLLPSPQPNGFPKCPLPINSQPWDVQVSRPAPSVWEIFLFSMGL